jgi:DNA-directed RNA polymerase specialized sigma24 family protein
MARTHDTDSEDQRLADRVRAGDRSALGDLYDRHAAGIYDFAVRTLRDTDRAGAVVRSAFERAWREIHADPDAEDIEALLYATARRAAMAELDSPSPKEGHPIKPAELAETSGGIDSPGKEIAKATWTAAASLDQEDYTLLDLSLRRGMETDDLADAFGLPSGPVARRLHRLQRRFEASVFARVMSKRRSLECAELHALLEGAGRIDAGLEQAVADHLEDCEICTEAQERLGPVDAFAALQPVALGDDVANEVWEGVESDLERPSLDPTATFRSVAPEPPDDEYEEYVPAAAVVVEETVADIEPVPDETEPVVEKRRRRSIYALVAAMVLVAAAVGATVALRQPSGGGLDPTGVHSATHQVGQASSLRVIRIAWTPADGAFGYSVRWSEGAEDLPDQVVDLPAAVTGTESPILQPADWYFHLRTRGEDGSWTSTVHLGPFPIVDDAATPVPSGSPLPTGSPVASASPGDTAATGTTAPSQGRVTTPTRSSAPSQAPASQAPAPPVPRITIQDATANEGNAGSVDMAFRVTLSKKSTRTVEMNYRAQSGSATTGTDFASTTGMLTFPAGTTSRTIGVPVYGDQDDEPNETLSMVLSQPSGAAFDRGTATGTIVDDDLPPTISISDASDDEGNLVVGGQLVFTVTLSRASSQAVTVRASTTNGSAQASDYTARSNVLITFNPGDTSETFTVTITPDTTDEPNETVLVNLSSPTAATVADGQGQGTIVDDD